MNVIWSTNDFYIAIKYAKSTPQRDLSRAHSQNSWSRLLHEPILNLAHLVDLDLLIKCKGLLLLLVADLRGHLVFDPFVHLGILELLVAFDKFELLQRLDFLADSVVLGCWQHSVLLGVESLQEGAIEHVNSLSFFELLGEQFFSLLFLDEQVLVDGCLGT